jgi:hypothetical protein
MKQTRRVFRTVVDGSAAPRKIFIGVYIHALRLHL